MELKPGYKQTEVGVIPEDWEVCPMSDVVDTANPIAYGVLKPGHYVQNGIPLLQIRDVIHGDIKTDQLHRISEELDSQYSRTRLLGGEIVVSLVGTIGRVALLPMSLRGGNLHRNLARIYVGDAYDSTFVSHVLKSDYAQAAIKLTTFGSSQALLNLADLRDLSIPVPPLPEQKAIAKALSDMDRLLSGLDSLISKKRDIKQATMQQLLTGKTRLPGFSGEWEVKRFTEVLTRINAKPHQIQTSLYQPSGTIPVVDQGKSNVVGFCDSLAKKFNCPAGGVIIFGDHTCIVKFIDFDFVVGADGTQILQGRSGQSTRFHALQLQYSGVEPTGYNRHFKFVTERYFLTPSLPEQQAIAKVLSDIDAELDALEQRRDKTRELKQAMMQELLTGRTRLV